MKHFIIDCDTCKKALYHQRDSVDITKFGNYIEVCTSDGISIVKHSRGKNKIVNINKDLTFCSVACMSRFFTEVNYKTESPMDKVPFEDL